MIHPAGVLTFSQRSLPLEDYQSRSSATRKPLNENQFKLSGANAGGLPFLRTTRACASSSLPVNSAS